ncbi:peptidoglycan bridge formation protein FemAB [Candidatus Beckwithbacteria bacterium CG10_big_fil_rev_8_21_14_0_10_34_10]|uniref:Peptidoglycan bridge formation protein FemAB n=1 Tax=Candidatus Beckwithbacteria bacterium CG10_big_fil_rev_8_21_14_0_10_34_10 TaxID=1974495 RepID=A0A2H0W9F6_9BACT|nr:MAG: peptidoglycan bridge formation protein FemAB [Candidatus Beckwithbacteria bacterium CG10_big_fil_rev_8_21_14_0_10_34_10]
MNIRKVSPNEKEAFNKAVSHPLQSWQWGEFKEKNGAQVLRIGMYQGKTLKKGWQILFHPIPKTKLTIGYVPKSHLPNKEVFKALKEIGNKNHAIFIKIEPNSTTGEDLLLKNNCLVGKPIFTLYTFQINLNKSEKELLQSFKSKTRYNLKLAQKKGVKVEKDNSSKAFNEYLDLTLETTKRQKFYAHDKKYHQLMWQFLQPSGIAHLLKASFKNKILATWIVFVFNNVLYYPYGASSAEHRDLMASNLMMWEAIRFGQKMNCHYFDLWGSLGPNPNPKNPWYGFHRFKKGYNPKLIEFIGSFDLILNKPLYRLYRLADYFRWQYLNLKATLFK